MSATAKVKVSKITYKELRPGHEFQVILEKRRKFSQLKGRETWLFQVLEILTGIAKVRVTFPSGHEEVYYFETAALGGWLYVYRDPKKEGYFLDDNIVDIAIL